LNIASNEPRRLVPKPAWVLDFEQRLAELIPVHPNAISTVKLVAIIPLLLLGLKQTDVIPMQPGVIAALFALFAFLDYLDGVVARHRDLATRFGLFYDRATDYPMLFALSLFCVDFIPLSLLAARFAVDLVLLAQCLLKLGLTENRLRTTIGYSTLLALLFLSQGWAPKVITPETVEYLLYLGIFFSATVALHNVRFFQRRFIADLLSAGNLACGVFSMMFAYRGRVDVSILFLLAGAAFDGFDGAAARRWGGTRWGVYSDDVADGVNYGVAPGAAIWFVVGGLEGLLVGLLYTSFTISRLVFFTLAKEGSDPDYFRGVPSTVGALIALSSLLLFPDSPLLLGLLVGVACVQMVSFDTRYRHVGRALSGSRRYMFGLTALLIVLVAARFLLGTETAAGLILAASLAYGFYPSLASFKQAGKPAPN